MTFLGLITFFDPPKTGVADTIRHLKQIRVSLKVITGDNSQVVAYVGEQLDLAGSNIVTGPQLRLLRNEALVRRVNDVEIFAVIEPNQKERVVLSLRKAGNVTGFMGDGINDASALHAADVGISVDQASQVAKEAADIVLLKKDLGVLLDGVRLGRVTFANMLKYVFMATSANFGNMFSMAGASLFLPFLPLLSKQILLTNLLTDLPEMAIATDSVDPEVVDRPRRWDLKVIQRFMVVFGLLKQTWEIRALDNFRRNSRHRTSTGYPCWAHPRFWASANLVSWLHNGGCGDIYCRSGNCEKNVLSWNQMVKLSRPPR
jgi:Mg2+-importing ATPase